MDNGFVSDVALAAHPQGGSLAPNCRRCVAAAGALVHGSQAFGDPQHRWQRRGQGLSASSNGEAASRLRGLRESDQGDCQAQFSERDQRAAALGIALPIWTQPVSK